jgi:hypothetical protein
MIKVHYYHQAMPPIAIGFQKLANSSLKAGSGFEVNVNPLLYVTYWQCRISKTKRSCTKFERASKDVNIILYLPQ